MEAVHDSSIISEPEESREVAASQLSVATFVASSLVVLSTLTLTALVKKCSVTCGCIRLLDDEMPRSASLSYIYIICYMALLLGHSISSTMMMANRVDGCVHYR